MTNIKEIVDAVKLANNTESVRMMNKKELQHAVFARNETVLIEKIESIRADLNQVCDLIPHEEQITKQLSHVYYALGNLCAEIAIYAIGEKHDRN
ncbi:MAG: hypothetical protein WC753_04690 [Candidatus Gracilibacteria bacterium]|jgi:hypothetical protein